MRCLLSCPAGKSQGTGVQKLLLVMHLAAQVCSKTDLLCDNDAHWLDTHMPDAPFIQRRSSVCMSDMLMQV